MIKKYKNIFFLSFTVAVFALFFLVNITKAKNNILEVTFLDVGQGDAILIETPFGQNILIDGSEDERVIARLGEELSWWDKKIDLMILTHPHSDHVGGLIDVLKRYNVLKILYTGASHNSPDYIAWLELIKEKNISLSIVNHPQKVILGNDCILEIIYPRNKKDVDEQKKINNTSIVAKLTYGQNSFLFTGDAEIETEKILLKNKNKLKADVLKLGHHGSDTSSSRDFLKAVHPSYAIIEVGADNNFGHPSPRVIKSLERLNIPVFRTDIDGSIKFISNGINLEIDK